MKKGYLALVLAAALLLTGCASVLERGYESVQPHTSQYWEDATASTLRVEDYQSLVNGLLMLASNHRDTALVRLYGYAEKSAAVQDMERACAEASLENALGAYLIQYISYDCEEMTNCYEMTLRFKYRRTPVQLLALVSATTGEAIPELLSTALAEGRKEFAVKVDYMNVDDQAVLDMVAERMAIYGQKPDSWEVTFYPQTGELGDTRIVEIYWMEKDLPYGNTEQIPAGILQPVSK